MYGSPPPPVPRIAAPRASAAAPWPSISRTRPPHDVLQHEVADRLARAPGSRCPAGTRAGPRRRRRSARCPPFAPAATALSTASCRASSSTSSRRAGSIAKTRSTSPPTCAIAAPMALANRVVLGPMHLADAGELVRQQDAAAADQHDRQRRRARAHPVDERRRSGRRRGRAPSRTSARSRWRTSEASPMSARPAATAMSVAVSVSPPNTSACWDRRKPTLSGPDLDAAVPLAHEAAAAEADRQHVGHPEVGAHPADHHLGRWPRAGNRCAARRRRSWCRRCRPPRTSSSPDRNAAPRIEFVGPEANVATG